MESEIEVSPRERLRGKLISFAAIAEQNARELIHEEEQAKMKAEKKKAKKKRQKLNKLQKSQTDNTPLNQRKKENNENANTINKTIDEVKNLSITSDNKEAEGFDRNAAFVSKAIQKVKTTYIMSKESKTKKEAKDFNSLIETAIDFQNKQYFKEAVHFFSEALNLQPKRIDILLKRSLMYYELAKFEKSVRDAQKVVSHSPNNAEGYYRLGEGHFALNNLNEAESAFSKLILLNSHIEEAKNRLNTIRMMLLENMGYHRNEAFTALLKSENKTLNEAIDYLTALEEGREDIDDLFYSDEEEEEEEGSEDEPEKCLGAAQPLALSAATNVNPDIVIGKKNPLLTDPSNPFGCPSLFVANLKKDITYKEVNDIFMKFGEVRSIKVTTEPTCFAFVNYIDSDVAGRAMEALQASRWLLSTVPLLIKYPTNIVNSIPWKNPDLIVKKMELYNKPKPKFPITLRNGTRCGRQTPVNRNPKPSVLSHQAPSNSAPANYPVVDPIKSHPIYKAVECYNWRTTGCKYDDDECINIHIPQHKGIAKVCTFPYST